MTTSRGSTTYVSGRGQSPHPRRLRGRSSDEESARLSGERSPVRVRSSPLLKLYAGDVAGWRVVAIVALSGVSVVTTASASAPRLFTPAATDGCLTSLPGAIVGLPPATPPAPPNLFVYSFPPGRLLPRVHAKLGAWYGERPNGGYEGVTLSFLKNVHDARASFKRLV